MEKKFMGQRRWLPALIVLLLVFLLGFAGVSAARYAMRERKKEIVEAGNFYFESDFLKDTSENNAKYFIDPMETEFPIKLYNYADSQRVTKSNIFYTLQVTGGTAALTSGASSGQTEIKGSIDGSAGQGTQVIYLTPSPSSGTGDRTVTVTAASTEPYAKTLSASFQLKKGNSYTVEDASGNRAAVLTMVCADADKPIEITFPDSVFPDEADERIINYKTVSGENTAACTFQSPGYGVYSIVLLKTDTTLDLSGNGSFAGSIVVK